jgi:hypothetical protein
LVKTAPPRSSVTERTTLTDNTVCERELVAFISVGAMMRFSRPAFTTASASSSPDTAISRAVGSTNAPDASWRMGSGPASGLSKSYTYVAG